MSPRSADEAAAPPTGIVAYAGYLPMYRLARSEIAAALGERAAGSRPVAAYDQDSTTLAVEAALPVVSGRTGSVGSLWFATTSPTYADKSNAGVIHAALDLPPDIAAADLGLDLRAGSTALLAAARTDGLAVLADLRGGAVGGADERDGADAAAAFLFGAGPDVLAHMMATASATAEFLDRWRAPGAAEASTWEERFGESRYADLTERVLASLGRRFDLSSVDRFAVVSANARAARTASNVVAKATGAKPADAEPLVTLGHAGAAQVGLALADLLDTASTGETLLVVSLADGADAIVVRTTDLLVASRGLPIRAQLSDSISVTYSQYLVWRGRVTAERPRRPEPDRPSAPYAWRNRDYKLALHGGRCRACGAVQYPVPEVCYRCHSSSGFDVVAAAGQRARIITFTVDRLAYSPCPPLISAVIGFEDGGRIQCEVTDVRRELAVGDAVAPTFRRGTSVGGIHNYIWKARPTTSHEPSE